MRNCSPEPQDPNPKSPHPNPNFTQLHTLLTLYTTKPTQKTLNSIFRQLTNTQFHYCHLYRQIMLHLLSAFRNQRHQLIDQRLTEYFLSLKWFEKSFQKDRSGILRKYFKYFQVVGVEEGTTIITEGSSSEEFYIIVEGRIQILKDFELPPEMEKKFRQSQQSRIVKSEKECLRELAEGEGFGEVGILYKRRRTASIVSVTKATLIKISANAYLEMCYNHSMAFHEKRYKFILEKFSSQIRGLTYDTVQQLLLQFEPVSFPYGNVLFNSSTSDYFVMIDQGTAATYQYFPHSKNSKNFRSQRKQTLGHGMFIGLDLLISLSQSFNTKSPPNDPKGRRRTISISTSLPETQHYQAVAVSSEVTGYRIRRSFLVRFLALHQQIMADLRSRKALHDSYQDGKRRRLTMKENVEVGVKVQKKREVCGVGERYRRMSSVVVRKIEEITKRKGLVL